MAVKTETPVKEKKKLGVMGMASYGIGNSIGSGIFVMIGSAVAATGKSLPLSLVLACVVVFFAYLYKTFMAGMFVMPGGRYSQQALLQPPLLVGVSAISMVFSGLAFAMYGLSIAEYAAEVFPVLDNYRELIALVIITIFFATTLLGGKVMGILNVIMVGVLIISLLIYIVVGLPKVDWASVNPFSEGYFGGGVTGFIYAVALLSFACQGSTMPIDMTSDAKDPKRTLPKAIILSSVVILVVYVLIGVVSSGVLPVEAVADKNLGVVAREIFPYSVFLIFMIGGACFAIATSLYSAIAGIRYPLMATVEDGWLPKFLGIKTKKREYPWVMMLLLYLIAVIPIFVDFGLDELVSVMMIPIMVLNTINNLFMIKLVKKYPQAWKHSFFHMPNAAFYASMIFAMFCSLIITVSLFTQLGGWKKYAMIAMVIFLFVYSYYRLKAGKVDLREIEEAHAEAERAAASEEAE